MTFAKSNTKNAAEREKRSNGLKQDGLTILPWCGSPAQNQLAENQQAENMSPSVNFGRLKVQTNNYYEKYPTEHQRGQK